MNPDNRDLILDQFTRQAARFAASPLVNAESLLDRMVELAQAGGDDSMLDSGSGPGVVVCAFASKVRLAIGVDLTAAMIEQARDLEARRGLCNVAWVRSDITALPFAEQRFSIVASRFVFHHLPDPAAAVREMARVCRPGGRIVVADSAPAAEKADAFNAMERLRDPSHVEALTVDELLRLVSAAGFENPRAETLRLGGDLDSLLARSFPREGDEARIRGIFEDALADDRLDMDVRRENGRILYGWPLAIVTATAAATRPPVPGSYNPPARSADRVRG